MTVQTSAASSAPLGAMPVIPGLEGLDMGALQEAVLQRLADERRDRVGVDDVTVIPSLHSRCDPDLLVNDQGQVLLIHEKPLPDEIWWVDYDPDDKQLLFVTVAGQIMPFGLPIHGAVDLFLRFARVMFFIEIDAHGKTQRLNERPVVVRKNGAVV